MKGIDHLSQEGLNSGLAIKIVPRENILEHLSPLFHATERPHRTMTDHFKEVLQETSINNADLEIELKLLLCQRSSFNELVNGRVQFAKGIRQLSDHCVDFLRLQRTPCPSIGQLLRDFLETLQLPFVVSDCANAIFVPRDLLPTFFPSPQGCLI